LSRLAFIALSLPYVIPAKAGIHASIQ
jgi:hypothetical protein